MSAEHPAKGCTKAQERAFELICIGLDENHSLRVLNALERKGLIEFRSAILAGGRFSVKVRVPFVPQHLFYQWCQWCDENVKDEAIE